MVSKEPYLLKNKSKKIKQKIKTKTNMSLKTSFGIRVITVSHLYLQQMLLIELKTFNC